jgi:hypothetical protein
MSYCTLYMGTGDRAFLPCVARRLHAGQGIRCDYSSLTPDASNGDDLDLKS